MRVLLLACLLLAEQGGAAERPMSTSRSRRRSSHEQHHLQTTLCRGKCELDCQTYATPLDDCYNGQAYFPNDPSWSKFDILDVPVVLVNKDARQSNHHSGRTEAVQAFWMWRLGEEAPPREGNDDDDDDALKNGQSFYRYIFASTNGACTGDITDAFVLPTDVCVGPFGAPRPWGKFTIVMTVTDEFDGDNDSDNVGRMAKMANKKMRKKYKSKNHNEG